MSCQGVTTRAWAGGVYILHKQKSSLYNGFIKCTRVTVLGHWLLSMLIFLHYFLQVWLLSNKRWGPGVKMQRVDGGQSEIGGGFIHIQWYYSKPLTASARAREYKRVRARAQKREREGGIGEAPRLSRRRLRRRRRHCSSSTHYYIDNINIMYRFAFILASNALNFRES
jgi:hypothetical protein